MRSHPIILWIIVASLLSTCRSNTSKEPSLHAERKHSTKQNSASELLQLGRQLAGKKEYKQAIAVFEEGLTLAPSNPHLWGELGWAAFHDNNLLLAEESTQKAFQWSLNDRLRGVFAYNLGRIAEAAEKPERAYRRYTLSMYYRPLKIIQERINRLQSKYSFSSLRSSSLDYCAIVDCDAYAFYPDLPALCSYLRWNGKEEPVCTQVDLPLLENCDFIDDETQAICDCEIEKEMQNFVVLSIDSIPKNQCDKGSLWHYYPLEFLSYFVAVKTPKGWLVSDFSVAQSRVGATFQNASFESTYEVEQFSVADMQLQTTSDGKYEIVITFSGLGGFFGEPPCMDAIIGDENLTNEQMEEAMRDCEEEGPYLKDEHERKMKVICTEQVECRENYDNLFE